MTVQEVADLANNLQKRCSPLFGWHLVESNIALTLSALKAQTEFFIETESDEKIQEIQTDVDTLNEYLDSEDKGIRFKNAGKIKKGNIYDGSA